MLCSVLCQTQYHWRMLSTTELVNTSSVNRVLPLGWMPFSHPWISASRGLSSPFPQGLSLPQSAGRGMYSCVHLSTLPALMGSDTSIQCCRGAVMNSLAWKLALAGGAVCVCEWLERSWLGDTFSPIEELFPSPDSPSRPIRLCPFCAPPNSSAPSLPTST